MDEDKKEAFKEVGLSTALNIAKEEVGSDVYVQTTKDFFNAAYEMAKDKKENPQKTFENLPKKLASAFQHACKSHLSDSVTCNLTKGKGDTRNVLLSSKE